MTTLVALNTMNGLVLGCDSLATVTRRVVDPYDLLKYGDTDGLIKISIEDLVREGRRLPYNHMSQVEKLFSLAPLDMGVMFSGVSSIGERTIQSIVEEFKASGRTLDRMFRAGDSVYAIAEELHRRIRQHYDEAYNQENVLRPELKLMVGGYDTSGETACVVSVDVASDKIEPADYAFRPYVGAQGTEIERILLGTDFDNYLRLQRRSDELLLRYRDQLANYLVSNGIGIDLPSPLEDESLGLFSDNWRLEGMDASWAEFSIQNAIDCVDWLVDVMILAHRFKSEMPTVGGPSQIGVIQKNRGLKYVSKRVWTHDGHDVPIEDTSAP